jgi:hypothetical protein
MAYEANRYRCVTMGAMPWNVEKSTRCPADNPWAVIGGASGDRIAGCHPDPDAARQQQKALYANEEKSGVMYTIPTTVAW